MARRNLVTLTWGLSVAVNEMTLAADGESESLVRPFLTQHCVRCHGEKKTEGNLRLDTLGVSAMGGAVTDKSAAAWDEVRLRISAREMPPPGEPQPKVEESQRVIEWIAAGD